MRGVEQIPLLYDAGVALLEATGLSRWRRWLASGARGLTLDLGCGTGRNLPLFEDGARPVGLDPCLETLRAARRRAPGVPLVLGRAEALPFRGGVFDTVVSGLVICSVETPAAALGEVGRVLAAAGRLRLLEHVRASGKLHAAAQDAFQPAWTFLTGGCRPNRDTESALDAAGFVVDPGSYRANGIMRRLEAARPPAPQSAARPLPGRRRP